MRFKYESSAYNEGFEAFKNRPNKFYEEFESMEYKQYMINCNYYEKNSQEYEDFMHGFDAAEGYFAHNAGGDW